MKTSMTKRDVWETPEEFKAHVHDWAERIGVRPRRVQLQEMRTKWASCSRSGTLTFSLDLLGESRFFGEHVIVHELLHLAVPNHGRLFRSFLQSYLPDADLHLVPEKRGRERFL